MNPSGFSKKKEKKVRPGQAQARCADPRMICVQSRDRSGHVLAPGLHIWNRTFLELTVTFSPATNSLRSSLLLMLHVSVVVLASFKFSLLVPTPFPCMLSGDVGHSWWTSW